MEPIEHTAAARAALPEPGPAAVRAADDFRANAYDPARPGQGVIECPRGSNRGEAVDTYNAAAGAPLGSYWCGSAVYFRLLQACREVGALLPSSLQLGQGFAPAAAASYAEWGRRHGLWIPAADLAAGRAAARKGDLVCFWLEGGIHHVGMVVSAGRGGLVTVEGNTHLDGDVERDGYCIAQRRRTYGELGTGGGVVRLGF